MQIQPQMKDASRSRCVKKNKHKKDLKVLSLFSGCGGMDLGFEGGFEISRDSHNQKINSHWDVQNSKRGWTKLPSTRFQTTFANDIKPGAQKVWRKFFCKTNDEITEDMFHLESVVDRVKRFWDGESDLFPKNIDVVTGGFPCQDFSVAGKRKGFSSQKNHDGNLLEEATEENRGKLYMWMREVVDITNPKVFIAENVKGLVSLGDVKEIIQTDFSNIGDHGYHVLDGRVLLAANYGIPQSRERVFFIGFRKDALKKKALKELCKDIIDEAYNPFPEKTHCSSAYDDIKSFVKLHSIFKDLKEPAESMDLDQKAHSKCKWYGKHCQGNSEVKLQGIGPTIRSEHHGNIEFRRLSKSHGGKNLDELNAGLKERRLTIRECCRIQTFPDDFKFVGEKRGEGVSASTAYKLIGNAVPPLLAFHLAKKLEDIWDNLFKK